MRTKEEIIEYQKEHYQKNIEVISIRHKTYRDEHAEQFRQGRKDNPEKYRERDRQNYLKRPPEYFEKLKEKVECCCGGTYTMSNRAGHFKTKKHQQHLQSEN